MLNDIITERDRVMESSSEGSGSEAATVANTFKSKGVLYEKDMDF